MEPMPSAPITASASRTGASENRICTPVVVGKQAVGRQPVLDGVVVQCRDEDVTQRRTLHDDQRLAECADRHLSVAGCRNHEPSRQRIAPAVIRPPASRTASPKQSSSSAASALGQIVMAAPGEVSLRRSMTLTS